MNAIAFPFTVYHGIVGSAPRGFGVPEFISKLSYSAVFVISKPGSVKTYKKFEAEIYVLTKDEGGRHTAFFSNYRPQFYMRTADITGKGGIEDGEEPISAAIRELQEETGIVFAELIVEVPKWLTYDFPPAVKAKVNRLWGGEWHGRAQKWFLMRLTKDEREINLGRGEPEFSKWKWATPEEVIQQAVDYKRPTYEEVMRAFSSYLNASGRAAKCRSTKW